MSDKAPDSDRGIKRRIDKLEKRFRDFAKHLAHKPKAKPKSKRRKARK